MKVKIPRNIKNYETKLIGGLGAKQLIFVAIGIVVGLLIGFTLYSFLPLGLVCGISIVVSLPIFLMGVLKVSNIYLHTIIARIYKNEFLGEKRRLYKLRGFNDEEK